VLGKLASALSYLLLLLLAAIPLQSLAFLFGGVTPEEVLIGSVLLVVTAVTFSAVGLFCSSLMKRTQSSTVLAYVLALFLTIGLPLIIAVLTPLLMRTAFVGGSLANASLSVSLYWLLLSISPLSAAIFTASNLATASSIFTASMFAGSGNTIQMLSPWIIYTIAYVLLTALLVVLTIRNVKRPEK